MVATFAHARPDGTSLMMDRAGQVRMIHEAKDQPAAWRVYVKEWVSDGWFEMRDEVSARLREIAGRYHDDDVKIAEDVLGGFMVWVRRWNVDSEWKHREAAAPRVEQLTRSDREAGDIQIVARASQEERHLVNYGTVLLG